jgi:hypothetical protein
LVSTWCRRLVMALKKPCWTVGEGDGALLVPLLRALDGGCEPLPGEDGPEEDGGVA